MLTQSESVAWRRHRPGFAVSIPLIAAVGLSSLLYHAPAFAQDECITDCAHCDQYSANSLEDARNTLSISYCQSPSEEGTDLAATTPSAEKRQGLTRGQRAALVRLFAAITQQ